VLVLLTNDVSLRKLIPAELAKGFGFVHGKPANAFSPVAVTLDELDDDWRDGKLHLPLCSYRNEQLFGNPDAGQDMQFNFYQLIAHAAKTRRLAAGTIIGSGTVSNEDADRGYACILEKIIMEILTDGKAQTEFLHFGERVRIAMQNPAGENIFGSIEQQVTAYRRP
jgi:fumarylacetoacetate (FAA) hydrolase